MRLDAALVLAGLLPGRGVNAAGVPAVKDFIFQVNLVAVVRVRAADENIARQVVPPVLGAPGNAEIEMANQNNAATGYDARVTGVDFSVGLIKPFRKSG